MPNFIFGYFKLSSIKCYSITFVDSGNKRLSLVIIMTPEKPPNIIRTSIPLIDSPAKAYPKMHDTKTTVIMIETAID